MMHSFCVVLEDKTQKNAAVHLSQKLGIPLLEPDQAEASAKANLFPYQLRLTEKGLELLAIQFEGALGKSRLFVDFLKGPMGYRRKHGGGYQEALVKAVGLKAGMKYAIPPLTILDATAGLGRDAFILASMGAKLNLIERSPIIAALLMDGLERALQDPEVSLNLKEKISVTLGDARDFLNDVDLGKNEKPDVIYLDPMFPEEKKTALAGIELRIIRDIVGADQDAEALFNMALRAAKKRVVVKRPIHAVAISDLKPSFVLAGQRNRYDVYTSI